MNNRTNKKEILKNLGEEGIYFSLDKEQIEYCSCFICFVGQIFL
jgi:hypothetical protein